MIAHCSGSSPVIRQMEEATSCLDVGFVLADQGSLAVWDSVTVKSQSAGRGQLRRRWVSPLGNIYAALRLPLLEPFDGTAASPAIGLLLASALRDQGWHVLLKWPNDLVLQASDCSYRKLGGILLEERGEVLLAGIGINVFSAPSCAVLRDDAALRAICLSETDIAPPRPEVLWRQLVNHAHSSYSGDSSFTGSWRARAERILLWRGEDVALRDSAHCEYGRLAGLSDNGGICLDSDGQLKKFLSGSLSLL